MGKHHFNLMWKKAVAVDREALPLAIEIRAMEWPPYSPSLSYPFTRVPSFDHIVHIARGMIAIRASFSRKLAGMMRRGTVRVRMCDIYGGMHDICDDRVFFDDDVMPKQHLLQSMRQHYHGSNIHAFDE